MGLWACGLLRNGRIRKAETKTDFNKMSNHNMGYSNTMGFRVTMGDLMYLWAVG